ncbi:trace amine-associated receptor 1 [Trichonephila inaurata madagascariensis]|uniref:Trace amine-associated receptor 1 n=1 Tax=Trichonephila inaurata madagascariensis TaxID=2747483 RepID=A0A8X7CDN9_9ARAC|nr:trace amine-associated receptor 1 [Trichonephila inaurata madagascariensis]
MMNSMNTTYDLPSKFFNATSVHDTEMHQEYRRNYIANISGSFATVFIALISIIGNLAVIIASKWDEYLKIQTGNKLIMYLSTIDILTSVFVMFPSAMAVACDYWPLGSNYCRAHTIFNYLCACSSSFIIAFISLDRAIAVTYPLKYTTLVTDRIMLTIYITVFSLGFVFATIGSMPGWYGYNYSLGVCSSNYNSINQEMFFYSVIAGASTCFYFPALVIGICNAVILVTARRCDKVVHVLFVRRHQLHPLNNSHMRKTIKSMIVVVLVYYACFTPYSVIKQLKVFFGISVPPWCNYLTTIFIFISSAVNPFIYAILRKDYREAFKKLAKVFVERCIHCY